MSVVAGVAAGSYPAKRRTVALLVGIAVWIAALVLLPAPLAARILLLGPLVVVPRLLPLLPARPWVGRLAAWPVLLAALPLLVAFSIQPGPLAGAMVLPWLALAMTAALAAVVDGMARLRAVVRPEQLTELGVDVALGFWAVGAAFTAADRLGIPTGFSPTIVLLTATHFHFAGLGLLGLASLMAVSRPWLRASVLGLIAGIPLTAAGFVLSSDAINAIGAVLVGLSGIGVAVALLGAPVSSSARWAQRAAGAALLLGMPMGIGWSIAILSGLTFLDLDTMIRTHGTLNALAVVLGVVAHRTNEP